MNPTVFLPRSVDEALTVLADVPDAVPVAGGTALMPDIRAGRLRPRALLGLSALPEFGAWHWRGEAAVLGAGLTMAHLTTAGLAEAVPLLAAAARGVTPVQVRNAATLGGNVVDRGDTLTALTALGAVAVCRLPGGGREVLVDGGPVVRPGELLTSVRVPVLDAGQDFQALPARGGARVTVALLVDVRQRLVRCAVGGVRADGPAVVSAVQAQEWLGSRLDSPGGARHLLPEELERFAVMVADEVRPHAEQRSLRAHRRRTVEVAVSRGVRRALAQDTAGGSR